MMSAGLWCSDTWPGEDGKYWLAVSERMSEAVVHLRVVGLRALGTFAGELFSILGTS